MVSLRIIHTADLHLGVQPSDFKSDRLADFVKNLNIIKEYTIKNNADILIIAGDVFHHPRPVNRVMYEFSVFIKDLISNGIHVVIVRGNHDASQLPEQRTFLDALNTLLGSESISVEGLFHYIPKISSVIIKGKSGKSVKIIGIPYTRPRIISNWHIDSEKLRGIVEERLKSELDAPSNTDYTIIAAHLSLEGFNYGSERKLAFLENEIKFSPNMFAKNKLVSYVAMGHIHKHQSIKFGDMNIVYSGSIERVDFSEASEKKYFIDIKEEHGNLIWNAVELDVRPMEIISLDTRGRSLNYVYDELKKRKIINALVKLTLKVGNKERELMKPENIIDYLNKLGAYDVRLDYELMTGEITMADETSKSDLETLFKEYVKNTVDPEIRDAVIERGLKLLKENLES